MSELSRLDPAGTLGAAARCAAAALRAAGIEPAHREARLLVALAAEVTPETVFAWPERPITPQAAVRLASFVDRRSTGEPFARLAGVREFWSMPFRLGAETLDPRPDTEILVESALEAVSGMEGPLRILDLGTGTGCILSALLRERAGSYGVGVDISPAACAVAADNAASLDLASRAAFVASDWADAITGTFDLIVSNPPYIPQGEIAGLDVAVRRFDPHRALAGGTDGFDAYRRIVSDLPRLMAPGSIVAFEIGQGQASELAALVVRRGLVGIQTKRDLAGIERVVVARAA